MQCLSCRVGLELPGVGGTSLQGLLHLNPKFLALLLLSSKPAVDAPLKEH